MVRISSITIKKLKNNSLMKSLPEFYELQYVVENNEWHHKDSVFNHTMSVLLNLEKLFEKYNKQLNRHLNRKIDSHSIRELLFLSALLHDIAKKETMTIKKGITSCPKHELKGALKAKKMLERFDLSAKERNFAASIIRNHLLIYNMFQMRSKMRSKSEALHESILIELSLLSIADVLGTQFKAKNPEEFQKRLRFYESVLKHSSNNLS